MTPPAGLVVIGHGPAGAAAAASFREQAPDAPVTVFNCENRSCYSRPRLPEVLAGRVAPEALLLHPTEWYEQRRIRLRLNRRAVRLDRVRRVVIDDLGGETPYEKLILATGAEAATPPLPGLPASQVFVLRTLEDALAIRLRAAGRRAAILVGGGLLGLEAGAALARLGLEIMVVEVAPWLLPRQVDAEGSALLQERLRGLGFSFFLGARVERIEERDDQVRLHLAGGHELAGDLALLSAGIIPRTELAREAGLDVKRGIAVNDELQTSDPDIYAVGDAAEWRGTVAGLWPAAQAMGRIAGGNAAGRRENYPGQVPSTQLKVAGVELCSQGAIQTPGAQAWSRLDPDLGQWTKLFVAEGRLVGSIQIGGTAGAAQFKRLIDRRLPVSGFENALLLPSFDFNVIPGFATPA